MICIAMTYLKNLKPPGMLSERNRKIPVVETSLGIWKIFIKQNSHKILRLTSLAQDAKECMYVCSLRMPAEYMFSLKCQVL